MARKRATTRSSGPADPPSDGPGPSAEAAARPSPDTAAPPDVGEAAAPEQPSARGAPPAAAEEPPDPAPPRAAGPPAETRGLIHFGRDALDRGRDTFERMREAMRRRRRAEGAEAARRAVGGRLDLLGGAFGTGTVWIKLFTPDDRPGFLSPQGEHIDLMTAVDDMVAWPDRQEYRLLGALGWAWTIGTVGGPIGALLGGGIRLLHPRRMFLILRLRDGRELSARTDSVTTDAVEAIVRAARGMGEPAGAS
jgi:hypothetical protein